MARIYKIQDISECAISSLFSGVHLAFGVFDGVHMGHMSLIDHMRDYARTQDTKKENDIEKDSNTNYKLDHERNSSTNDELEIKPCDLNKRKNAQNIRAVLTFDIDPDEMFCPKKIKKLMSNTERIQLLAKQDVDVVFVLPFTKEFAQLTPVDFLNKLFGAGTPASIHVGQCFRFGYKAQGTCDDMRKWAHDRACNIFEVPLAKVNGCVVSATRIRGLLLGDSSNSTSEQSDVLSSDLDKMNFNLSLVRELLGRRYSITDVICAGRHEGAKFGIATANLHLSENRCVLKQGVYAAYAHLDGDSHIYKCAVCVGVSPTFSEARANIEAHLLNFDGNIYGLQLTLEFEAYLRPLIEFSTTSELVDTLKSDISRTTRLLDDERFACC